MQMKRCSALPRQVQRLVVWPLVLERLIFNDGLRSFEVKLSQLS